MITATSTETAKFYIKGTDIEVESVVFRTQSTDSIDGTKLQVALHPFQSNVTYQEGKGIFLIDGTDEILAVEAVEAVEASEGVEAVEAVAEVKGVRGFTIAAYWYDLANGDGTNKDQSRLVAHELVKSWLEDLGYIAEISGI